MLEGLGLAAMRGDRLIFADIDLSVAAGGMLTLTGRNGAGKSTLMRIVAGLARPFTGEVRWRGEPVSADPDGFRSELLYSGHKDGMKTALTAVENLNLAAQLRGGGGIAPRKALERFGIADLADLPVGYMSAGQRRRVALSRVLVEKATLWLLDEPITALDRDAVAVLGEVMTEHLGGGGLIVAATHTPLPGVGGETMEIRPPEFVEDWYEDAAAEE